MTAVVNGVYRLFVAGWGQFAAAFILLGSIRLYTEVLSPSGFGEAMLVLGGLGLVDSFARMAFAQTCAQFLKDRADRAGRCSLGLGLAMRVRPIFAAICAIGCGVFALFFGVAEALPVIVAATLYVIFEPIQIVAQSVVQLERRYTIGSLWIALDAAFILGISFLLIEASMDHTSVLLLGAIAGRVITALILCPLVLGSPRKWRPDRDGAKDLWPRAIVFGRQVAMMAPIGWLSFYVDRYLVGTFVGLEAAGLFAALSGAVSRPFSIASAGMTNLFRPELLDRAAGRAPVISRPLLRWIALAAGIGLLGTLGFAVFGDWFARLLIADSHGLIGQAGTLMTILALSQWLVIETHAVDNELLARGASRRMLIWQSVTLVAGLPLIVFGALEFAVLGAAWGRFGNEGLKLLTAVMLLYSIRRSRGAKAITTP